jgi:hypothetical protein
MIIACDAILTEGRGNIKAFAISGSMSRRSAAAEDARSSQAAIGPRADTDRATSAPRLLASARVRTHPMLP